MSTQSDLAELYTTFFNRAPDAGGLAYWVNDLDSGKITLAQIAQNWTTLQPEGLTNFPATLTNAQFIEKIYNNILGRTADAGGAQYWQDQLASGAVTRDSFAVSIINGAKANTSAQGVLDSTLISNKATVGVAFANQGLNDTSLAAKVLTTVTADASTLNSTLAVISLIPATAAAQTPAILAAATQLLTNYNALITAAPGELADATTYLQTLVSNVSANTNLATLLTNASTLFTTAANNPAALDNPATQGSAAVVVATPATGGGGTPPTTPSPTLIEATSTADIKTLTAGVDTFVTKFAVDAVKQVDTVTLSGSYEAGDKVNLEINAVTTSYTVLSQDIFAGDAVATIAAIAAKVAALDVGSAVTLLATPTGLTVTAATPGTPFTAGATTTNFAGTAAVPQVDTVTLSGTYEAGDKVNLDINNVTTSYTVLSQDIVAGDAVATIAAIAAKVAALDVGSAVTLVATPTGLTVTAANPGTPFTAAANTTNFAGTAAVPQVDTVTLSGTYEAGDKVNLDINNVTTSYTVLSQDIIVGDAAATIAAISLKVAALNVGSAVTLASTPTGLTVTAATSGVPFTAGATTTNFAGTPPVAQVDTVVLSGAYGDSDIVRVTVDGNTVSYTLVAADIKGDDAATIEAVALKVVAAVAADPTVSGLVTAAANATGLTLTAKVAGTEFTSSATTQDGDFANDQVAASSNTTANVEAGTPGVDTQAVNAVNTTPNQTQVPAGVNTQVADVDNTTANQAGVPVGANTQVAAGLTTTINVAASDSLSKVGALDILTNFTVGTDKVHLLTNLGFATVPNSLERVADVATSNDLAGTLASSFASLTPNQAGVVVISGGTASGTYLYADNGNGIVDASADVFIKLVGVTPGAIGTLDVTQYFA